MSDTTKPALTQLGLPGTVNLSGGGHQVTFSLGASDDLSGLDHAYISFDKSFRGSEGSGEPYLLSTVFFGTYDDPLSDGQSSHTFTFDPITAPGTYKINQVFISDKSGNQRIYSGLELATLGFSTSFTVTGGTVDTTKPALTQLGLPGTVNLSGGGHQVTFSLGASDDLSGLDHAYISFDKSFRGSEGSGEPYLLSTVFFGTYDDPLSDGQSSHTFTFDPITAPGTYKINQVFISDKSGNQRIYSGLELATLGFSTSFTVTGGTVDTTKPALTQLGLPGTVNLSGGGHQVTFSLGASDDLSGLDHAYISFDKSFRGSEGSGEPYLLSTVFFGTYDDPLSDGQSSHTFTFDPITAPGTYKINQVFISDKSGNQRIYSGLELATLGFSTSFTVGPEEPPPPRPPTGSDTIAPTLTLLSLPGTINLNSGTPQATFTLGASDNLSGIESAWVSFDRGFRAADEWGNTYVRSVMSFGTSTDPLSDGQSSTTLVFDPASASGTFNVTYIGLTDKSGNQRSYTAADLAALGFNTSFTVSGGLGDTTAPTLTLLNLPGTINLNSGTPQATFALGALDNLSGIESAWVSFDRGFRAADEWGNTYVRSVMSFGTSTDPLSDGQSSTTLVFEPASASGTFNVTYIGLTDKSGNQRSYTAADLAALGFNTSFTVSGGLGDTTAPTLTLLNLPGTINLNSGTPQATFALGALDNLSGIESAWVSFDRGFRAADEWGNTYVRSVMSFGTSTDPLSDGQSSTTLVFDPASASGTFNVTYIGLTDKSGNQRSYTAADLAALGFNTSFTLTNQPVTAPDTTPPVVAITSAGGLTNQATQTISGTVDVADAGTPVSLYDNGGSIAIGTTTVQTDGTWSISITLFGNGSHSIVARDTDAAGNTGTSSAVTFTLDTTPPTVAITSAGGLTNQANQTISGTVGVVDAGSTVSLYDNGGATAFGTAIVQVDGTWSTTVTLAGNGTHSIVAEDTDAAGNTGRSSQVVFTRVTAIVESSGATSLAQVGDQFFLYGAGGSGPALKYAGAAFVAGQFGSWTPMAAEQTATGYEVAWKVTGADQYTVWATDPNGNYVSSLIGAVSGASTALELFEPVFQQDLNGDSLTRISHSSHADGELKSNFES